MLSLIENIMWLGLGYVAFIQLIKILEKEFGKFDSNLLLLPCIYFTLLGGITAVITMLFWLAWEWDGKLIHNTKTEG